MKIHLTTLLSSLFLFSLRACTNASQPKTMGCESDDFLPYHTSCGVDSTNVDEGDLFTKCFSMSTTSTQNSCASLEPLSMILAFSINVLFILSTTPFCFGVYGLVFMCVIPHYLQNHSKFFPHNSPPFPFLITLIFLFVWFSTRDLSSLKFSKNSDFFLRKYSHVFLEKSSMKET
jgi:hypothetical protein